MSEVMKTVVIIFESTKLIWNITFATLYPIETSIFFSEGASLVVQFGLAKIVAIFQLEAFCYYTYKEAR